MTRPLLTASGLLLLLLAGLVGIGRKPSGAWTPEGYVQTANALINDGNLWLECHDPGTGRARDTLHTEFVRGSPQAAWFAASYLREDVRRFNSDPEAARTPFLVDGCRLLGVDPFFHRVDLPNQRIPRWRGDILLSGDKAGATLEGASNGQLLEIRQPQSAADAAQSARVSPASTGMVASASLLRIQEPWMRRATGEVTADLFMAGQHLMLADRRNKNSPARIRVQGFATPPGRLVRLEPGDWVQFGYPGEGRGRNKVPAQAFTYLANVGEQGSVASFVRVQNRDVRRVYPAVALRPFLEPFSQAMDVALSSVAGGDRAVAKAAAYDIHLTLDRDLSERLGSALARWCAAHQGATRPRSISMLVMDGLSGGVRAMPSCPDEAVLAAFEPLPVRERDRWMQNQNLVPHPIGSAGKPFWAAAVGSRYPNLLDLQVRGHDGGNTSVLGCPIQPGYADHAHDPGGWVGMESFMAASCNRYMIDYASAALMLANPRGRACERAVGVNAVRGCFPSPPPGPRDTLRFCDQLVEVVLSPSSQLVERSGCGNLQLLDMAFPPARSLGALANLQWYWQGSSRDTAGARGSAGFAAEYRSQRYRVDAWRRVLSALEAAGDSSRSVTARLRFTSAAPEAANLALNTVEDLRGDWVNLLLGGENSRWSNYQLAEATARLITGRRVVGEFVDSIGMGSGADAGGTNAANQFAEIAPDLLHPGVRRRVLHAMERVVEPGGTAQPLAGPILTLRRQLNGLDPRKPYDLYVFAKTGTPNVSRFHSSVHQQLLERLYRQGGVVWDASSRTFRDTRARRRLLAGVDARTRRWLDEDILDPIQANPELYQAVRGMAPPDHPLYFDARGQLQINKAPGREVTRQGGVLVLGFLAVPAERGRLPSRQVGDYVSSCALDAGLRDRILEIPPVQRIERSESVVLTTAIYVDDLNVGQGSGVAVQLARYVFPVLEDYLLDAVKKKL
jgi:hypothetical protein